MGRIAVVSFRLGGTDGVSIEAAKWSWALGQLGHEVTSIAGSGTADILFDGLRADASTPPSIEELRGALSPFDLVVVENLASLPLNVAARDVLYRVLHGRDALFRHHDLPWQRAHLSHLEGPRDEPTWRHVTINDLSRRQLLERGIDATTIYNAFDMSPAPGRRDHARTALALSDERLVVMATRAIPRKNVAGAIELCERLDALLWLMGPAEDGYEEQLRHLLESSKVPVRRMMPDDVTMSDAYAASDLVVMPSTWEGFGNPVLESVVHRRPLALNRYPVAREITALGFTFFDLHDVAAIRRFWDHHDDEMIESNLAVARQYFDLADLPRRIEAVLASFDSPLSASLDD
jgi:glycosyltransferase involved in cell wall biosynthesis